MIVVKNESHYIHCTVTLTPLFLSSSFLSAYVIFAIGDSIFHFTGDKSYIDMLHDFMTGLIGRGG